MSAILALSLLFLAPSPLDPPSLATWDGQSWAGITINRDTDADMKRRFKHEKGAVVPEALKIVTTKPRDIRVDVIEDGRGAKAVARVIRVGYEFAAPTPDELSKAWDEEPTPAFTQGRNEDWNLLVWPKKGVVAQVLKGRPVAYLLVNPSRIDPALNTYVTGATDIEPVRDPGEGWIRELTYGNARASADFKQAQDGMETGVRRLLEYSAMRYSSRPLTSARRGETLEIKATLGAYNNDGKASAYVSMSLRNETPYGPVTVNASNTRTIDDRIIDGFDSLASETLNELSRNAAAKLKQLGPPPIDADRNERWKNLYAALAGYKR